MDLEEVKEAICDIPGVLEVKSLHIWSLTIGKVALAGTVHLQPEIKDLKKASMIVKSVRKMIRERYRIRQSTIQVALYTAKAQQASTTQLQDQQQQRLDSTLSDNNHGGNKHSVLQMDTLARHDQDIIFSIDDEDLETTTASPHGRGGSGSHVHSHAHFASHSHLQQHGQQISRAGTPLNLYRKNSHAKDDDESETEMEQEVQPKLWT